jgi:hypothetical protein
MSKLPLLLALFLSLCLYPVKIKSAETPTSSDLSEKTSAVNPLSVAPKSKASKSSSFVLSDPVYKITDLIVKVVNIAFVVWFFSIGRSDRKRDKTEKEQEKKKSIHSFWFQEFFLKPNQKTIADFFRNLETLFKSHVDKFLDLNQVADVVSLSHESTRALNRLKSELSNSFVAEIGILDPKLAVALDVVLDNLQDNLSAHFTQIPGNLDSSAAYKACTNAKQQFLRHLFSYHEGQVDTK